MNACYLKIEELAETCGGSISNWNQLLYWHNMSVHKRQFSSIKVQYLKKLIIFLGENQCRVNKRNNEFYFCILEGNKSQISWYTAELEGLWI